MGNVATSVDREYPLTKPSDEDLAISPIPIADQIAGSLFPTASFRELICDPFCCRMRCNAKPQNLSSTMPHNQQAVEQPKRDCRDDEQIHRRHAVGMIIEKCFPTLGRRPSTPGHILGYARLTDIDAELEKLSMDARRAPRIEEACCSTQRCVNYWFLESNCVAARSKSVFNSIDLYRNWSGEMA